MAKYCFNCGNQIKSDAVFCSTCGTKQMKNGSSNIAASQNKSKVAAGLFGLFFGGLGVHNFYLGYTSKAVAQLLLTLIGWIFFGFGPLAASIWGFVEGILILTGSINTDAEGNELTD